jgi:arginine metabolism regulation protein II
MPFFPHQDDDPLGLLSHVATQQPYATSEFPGYESRPTPNSNLDRQNTDTVPAVPDFQPPPHTADEIDDAEILEDSKILLKHFRDIVIPQFAPLPSHSKSPWEVLNWSGAVQTHSDMTYLMSTTVNHANKANLYAILACSAYSIEKAKIYPAGLSNEKTSRILEYVGTRAKCHMQESLRTETSGPSKAKYKEQLMAILSLIALTVCICRSLHRCLLMY